MSNENTRPTTPLSSPLAISGAFLYMIRNRFTSDNNLFWTWYPDNTTTSIIIEAQFNSSTETEDARPGIYVDQGSTIYNKVSVGNFDQAQPRYLSKGLEHFISIASTDISLDCISPNRGESIQLADIVQTYIESSKYAIMRAFGFRDISASVMGRTDILEKQTYLHQTSVNFRIEYERRWATLPVTPLLKGLRVKLNKAPDQVLADFFLNSVSPSQQSLESTPGIPTEINPLPSTTNDDAPRITGFSSNRSVDIMVDGHLVATVPVIGGAFSFTSTLTEGIHTITARGTDTTGAPSQFAITPQLVVVDTTPPAAPVITTPATDATTPMATTALRGTGEPNTVIEILSGGVVVATTTVDPNGNWVVLNLPLS